MARGRKPKEFDKELFESLCMIQCTEEEICWCFRTTPKTLNAWCKRTYKDNFSQVFSQKRGMGKISLRRTQWQMAQENVTMAIFLGKQYLGQSDNKIENTDKEDALKALDEVLNNIKSSF